MSIDFKKEIKLSDLFRRGSGPAPEDARPQEAKPEEKKEGSTFWTLKRSPKKPRAPKEPRARKEKEPRARKQKEPRLPQEKAAPKAGPALPAVPLMRAFNLMPKEGEGEQKTVSAGLARIALALVGILVVVGLGAGYMLMSARAGEKQSQVDDLRAQLAEVTAQAPDQGDDGGATTASLAGEGQARTAALADALATRVAWDRILREFALVVPEDVWLTTLSSGSAAAADGAVGAPASFTIAGSAQSHESVALLLSRLSVLPEFASVQLQSSARGGGTEGGEEGEQSETGPATYTFSIVATLMPGGVTTP